jgi:hemolysin activation/secretion protein
VSIRSALIGGAAALLAGPVAVAQTLPGTSAPGLLFKQFERQQQQFEQTPIPGTGPAPTVTGPAQPPTPALPQGGPTFKLRQVTFDKSALLPPASLEAIAGRFVGKSVSISDLQRLVDEVNELYAKAGQITARASLPPQHITDGAVHIRLTEGKVGKLTIDGLHQTSPGYVERRLDLPQGSVVDTPALTDRVRLLDRTSDVQVRIALQPGQAPGLTDVIADATEPPRDTLQFFYDNQGVVTTGQDEVGVYYKRHSLLGIDDRLTFFGTYSAGDLSGNLGYNVPITPYGTRLGLTGGHSAVRIVNGPLGPIHVTGESNSTTLTVTQPAIVTEHWTVIANGGYGWENSLSSVSQVSIQDVDSSTESLGISISYATDTFAAQISPGVDIVQSHDHILDQNRDFSLFTGSGSAQVMLPLGASLSSAAAWQWTGSRLLPSNQLFQIGGPTTVRGYPTDAIAGDSGFYANLELHRPVEVLNWLKLDPFVFGDIGSVASTFPTSTTLTSLGVGMSATWFNRVTTQVSAGFPLTHAINGQRGSEIYFRIVLTAL